MNKKDNPTPTAKVTDDAAGTVEKRTRRVKRAPTVSELTDAQKFVYDDLSSEEARAKYLAGLEILVEREPSSEKAPIDKVKIMQDRVALVEKTINGLQADLEARLRPALVRAESGEDIDLRKVPTFPDMSGVTIRAERGPNAANGKKNGGNGNGKPATDTEGK